MSKLTLPFLETMITQVCNLSCLGCSNYSDLTHSGYVNWETGKSDIEAWLRKVNIGEFGIIGGEPLINPEWKKWLSGIRTLMPDARIRFTTNGLLLHKHPDMINFIEDLGNITFKITVHLQNQQLDEQIELIKSKKPWGVVEEFGIKRWAGPNGLRLQINRPQQFIKTYQNTYDNMMPWNSDSVRAFDMCCQQTCPLLYKKRIYKCSTAGLLYSTLEKFNFPNFKMWEPYINSGIGLNDSDDDLARFVENFGKPNKICSQCPSTHNHSGRVNHLLTVNKK